MIEICVAFSSSQSSTIVTPSGDLSEFYLPMQNRLKIRSSIRSVWIKIDRKSQKRVYYDELFGLNADSVDRWAVTILLLCRRSR